MGHSEIVAGRLVEPSAVSPSLVVAGIAALETVRNSAAINPDAGRFRIEVRLEIPSRVPYELSLRAEYTRPESAVVRGTPSGKASLALRPRSRGDDAVDGQPETGSGGEETLDHSLRVLPACACTRRDLIGTG
jgi:hypothetical protein